MQENQPTAIVPMSDEVLDGVVGGSLVAPDVITVVVGFAG